ncbi:MAG: ABC transporter ATP-binding protein [Clostridia bacterium]|nr:ABC transporter ATP-binding protein [Clostridia bacterium]
MICLQEVSKVYREKGSALSVEALRDITFRVAPGEFLAVTGGSGSGKTTLMNIVGCLDRPTSGTVRIDGEDPLQLNDRRLSRLRNEKIGFVFQGFNLLSGRTALENVMLPLAYRGIERKVRQQMAVEALEQVGLGDRLDHRPGQLSGGQQQRVAIARVIACKTPIILADEPTGNLDPQAAANIMGILQNLNRQGVTILLITHDPTVAAQAKSRAVMREGRLYRQPN